MLSLLINKLFSANIDQNITKVNKLVKMYIHFNIHKQHIINLLLVYFKTDPNYEYLHLQKTINFNCSDFIYIFDWISTGDP